MKLLCNLKYRPHQSHELIFDRFINTHGIPAKNIPMDLHLEHLNNFLKEQLKSLRSNLNEKNAKRISEAMNNIRTLVLNTEINLEINRIKSGGRNRDYRETVRILVKELKENNPFVEDGTYKYYESFEYFEEGILTKQDTTRLLSWTKEKSDEFKQLIELESI